ncbi:hypothetical protein LXL04_031515 [Taraxacum kok-saghyz]
MNAVELEYKNGKRSKRWEGSNSNLQCFDSKLKTNLTGDRWKSLGRKRSRSVGKEKGLRFELLRSGCNGQIVLAPSNLSFGETQNTLHWADRAKEICTKACEANEEITDIPNSEIDQAKLLLELQKDNRDLRAQLARQQQKLLMVQAQSLVAVSPTPSTISSILTTPPTSCRLQQRRTRPSFLPTKLFHTGIEEKSGPRGGSRA